MDRFILEDKETELELLQLEDYMESEINMVIISERMMSTTTNSYYTESEMIAVYESKLATLKTKIADAIEHVIQVISDFISKSVRSITDFFTSKKAKEAIEICDKNTDKIPSETVEMLSIEKDKKRLDEYIRELASLERELLAVKVDMNFGVRIKRNNAKYIITCNEILHKIDALNAKYDRDFLRENDNIIKMASKDAVRFSDKDLKKVRVDYAELEANSKKILKAFKTDANGCDVPEKLNVFSKLINSLSTRIRKVMVRMTSYKKKNISKVVIIGSAVVTALGIRKLKKMGVVDSVKPMWQELKKEIKDEVTQDHPKLAKAATSASETVNKAKSAITNKIADSTPGQVVNAMFPKQLRDAMVDSSLDAIKIGGSQL